MNIVQLHERVRFWTDTVGSARFEPSDLDNAVNTAMNDIIEERYLPMHKQNKGDSFQRSQRIRDELSSLVEVSDSSVGGNITLSNFTGYSIIPFNSYPANYKYLLAIATYDASGNKYNCWPITYDRINIIEDNPYRRVRLTPDVKQYYNEGSEGIRITTLLAPVKAVIHYLSVPIQWNFGLEWGTGHNFNPGDIIIVTSESVVYNGATYLRGATISIINPFLQLTSGTAVVSYSNSNVNVSIHEEIARKGAINALISIKEFDKAKAILEFFI